MRVDLVASLLRSCSLRLLVLGQMHISLPSHSRSPVYTTEPWHLEQNLVTQALSGMANVSIKECSFLDQLFLFYRYEHWWYLCFKLILLFYFSHFSYFSIILLIVIILFFNLLRYFSIQITTRLISAV